MGRYFVTDPPVPVPDPKGSNNIIWIKARMDVETRGKVRSELAEMGTDGKTPIIHAGAAQLALLLHNIVRWEGPDLGLMSCTPAAIRMLDPADPHIEAVLNEIGARNTPKESPNPKSAGASTLESAGIAGSKPPATPSVPGDPSPGVSHQLATTTATSPLRSALAGRLNKSGDSIPITSRNS